MHSTEKEALLAIVRQMADFFWGPNQALCADLLKSSFWQSLESILPNLDPSAVRALESIKAFLTSSTDSQTLYESLEEEYVRLFINDRQGIRTPLYASCYADKPDDEKGLLMGEPALAMGERFLSKGLSLADDIGEPPDHLSIELEYLYFLLNRGWADNNHHLVDEASSFVSESMLSWVMELQHALSDYKNEGPFYLLLTTILITILKFIEGLNERP